MTTTAKLFLLPASRPARVRLLPLVPGNPGLAAAIGPHHVECFRLSPLGAENDEPAIRRPAGVLVAAVAGQLHVARSIGIDGVNLKTIGGLPAVDEPIPFGGPAGTDVVGATGGQAPDVGPVHIHDKELGLAKPVRNKGDLAAIRRPGRGDV